MAGTFDDKRLDHVKHRLELRDQRILAKSRGHVVESAVEKVKEFRLVQELGPLGAVIFLDDGCEHFRAAHPAAQAYELREIFVVELVHCPAHILKGSIEFPADAIPIPGIGLVDDRLAAGYDGFFYAHSGGEVEYVPTDLLHSLAILRLHGDKTFGDHGAQQQGDLSAHAGILAEGLAKLALPIWSAQLVEHVENLAGHWHDDVLHGCGWKLREVDLLGRRIGTANHRRREGGNETENGDSHSGHVLFIVRPPRSAGCRRVLIMNRNRIHNILRDASSKRILVIGDVMLDEFVWGKVSRISPEAPVPVVEVSHENSYPGGAANVARNLAEFVGSVRVLGLVGCDAYGLQLRNLLEEERIRTDCLVENSSVPTIVKTRVIARQQQVVRVDREKRIRPDASLLRGLLEQVERVLPETDAIIFEDYGKGLLIQEFKDAVCAMAAERNLVITVDPNPSNPLDWSGVTTIKPNRAEAFAAAGVPQSEPAENPLEDAPLLEVGRRLIECWKTKQLLVTLSEHGMILFDDGLPPYHTPTRAQEVFDVSGAGDTAIALYTLSLAAGATAREAAEVANHASGIVVGKLGTATVSPGELTGSFPE